jgi:arabinogalactan oligomer/maltooligosaccharide transport system permease protein
VKRASLLAVLLGALLLALLPGCAEPAGSIVLWHPYGGGEEAGLKQFVARYERDRGVRVTALAVPYEAYLSKLEAAIPRGNGPDLFLGPHNRLGEYLLHRLVAPAGDAFPDGDVDRYHRSSVEAVTYAGQRYAVPVAQKCLLLYLNLSVLKATRFPPETLDEILADKGTLPPGVYPLAYEAENVYYHAPFLHAYGGRLFDDGFAMTGDAAERSLARVRELVASGAVPADASADLVKQLLESGRAGAVISGPWLAADLKHAGSYRIVPLPALAGAGKLRPFLTVDGAFLTVEGAKHERVRALARELGRSGLEGQIPAAKREPIAPEGPRSLRRDLEWAVGAASEDAIPMPVSPAMNPAWDPAKQALRKVLRGDASPRDALAEARARYDDVMRAPPPRGSPGASPGPLVVLAGLALLAAALALVRRVRAPGFRRELRAGLPAYRYVAHAALTIVVLVVLPLLAGAATSFFSGGVEDARFVGLANYVEILTARGKPLLSHGSFYLTLLVTVVWTIANVALHVALGLVLGVALARPLLRLRAVYRVLLVIPWAVPSYVTALAWKGMFHRQFGAVNALLGLVGVAPISWFSRFSTAFTANVATNVWLGFPFMMVVVMGALTSISRDVLEAAEVDGATRLQTFRLVTLPLLRPTLLPSVVLGSIWTFNMFNVVFLVSGGEPDGTTDILVSEAYRWAFTRNGQLGYAAAYAVLIFGLLALIARATARIGADGRAG